MDVKGTIGYAAVTQKFIEATLAIDFYDLHRDFIEFIPKQSSHVLDIGAGVGRDPWEFSKMGHHVIAVEPTLEYREAGMKLFKSPAIRWIDDSLPKLETLGDNHQFDFVIASGVFHHLDIGEQHDAISRVAQLLNTNGIFALSLRNGPAGAGTHIFSTNSNEITEVAEANRLETLFRLDNQPSLMKNKKKVSWSKLVFRKT